jgi:short-subunit dehydrogenase
MKNIWIIGATTGIGKSLAELFASQGHNLAISGRNVKRLDELISSLPNSNHISAPMDVCKVGQIQKASKSIFSQWSKVDQVIFLAGIYQPMKINELDLKLVKDIIETNLIGAINLTNVILDDLISMGNVQFSFCASVAGYRGLPNSQPYGASKAGLINFVQSLNVEHGKEVDIRLINPGFVKTRLTDKNEFEMPMIISANQAAKYIDKGLSSQKFEVHFPKKFSLILKLLNLLPTKLYNKIARSLVE